ncbi:MAG: ABC transporter permease [Betaproteobacteria bacterium]|nr:ABC transporter permease [Betaproteobacteria bacterium]
MKAWLTAHIQACERAFMRFRFQPVSSLLSVAVIGIAITLPLGLYLLFANITAAASRVNTDPDVNVYLALNATDQEARELEKRLKQIDGVSQVKFVSRETALAEMKRVANLADLLTGLESNPLPHAFSLRPASSNPETLTVLRKNIAALPKVEHVVMDFEWAQKLKRFATFAERLVMLLGIVLASAVVFVTGNTIRLQILTQKDEIEVSQLIGATRRFIRRPFLYFGAVQGFFAGLVAIAVVSGIVAWIGSEVQALTVSYGSEFALQSHSAGQALGVVALSALLGWLGALISVSLYLRQPGRL